MSIRRKTLLVIITTMLITLAVMHLLLNFFVISGFSKVESEYVEQNISRVQDAITQNVSTLCMKSADWAKWDDTYNFMITHSSEYIKSNLNAEAVTDLDLSMIIFVDTTGNLLYGFEKDSIQDTVRLITNTSFKSLIEGTGIHLPLNLGDSIYNGIISVSNSTFYIVARPILRSDGSGPSRGTLIFTRFFNDIELNRLSNLTHVKIEFDKISGNLVDTAFSRAKNAIKSTDMHYIQPLNKDTIAGYFVLNDIFNKPCLTFMISMNRSIYEQGYSTYIYLIYFSIISAIFICIISLFLMNKSVLEPLIHLAEAVKSIGHNPGNNKKIVVKGKNELSYLANSINTMLENLLLSEQALRERNSEMKLIMDTLPSGLITLDSQLRIKPEYSHAVESILRRNNLSGFLFPDILFPSTESKPDKDKLIEFLDVLLQDIFPEKELAPLNPFEKLMISTENGTAWISLNYHLMNHERNGTKNILVDIQDITESIILERRIKSSEELNTQLKIILEDPELFKYFLFEISETIEHAVDIINNFNPEQHHDNELQSLFKHVHTIKGTAGSFGLNIVAKIADDLETIYYDYKKLNVAFEEFSYQSKLLLGDAAKTILDATINFRNIVGEDYFDTIDLFVKVPLNRIHSLHLATLEAFRQKSSLQTWSIDTIDSEFRKLREIPAKRGFAKSLKIVQQLLKRYTKDIQFNFTGLDIQIDYETAHNLNTALIHILRNAFDHAIEYPDERQLFNKCLPAKIEVRLEVANNHIIIEIEDDGRGIDTDSIKKTAVEKGIVSPDEISTFTKNDLLRLIFKSGFSTAESADDISGRGLGMSAALDTVTKLHGQIDVKTEIHKGTCFIIKIPVPVY